MKLIAVAAAILVSIAAAQPPRPIPALDIRAPMPPVPFVAGARQHLVYELHITNLSPRQTTVTAIEARDGAGDATTPLWRLEGPALRSSLRRIGAPPDDPNPGTLGGGQTAIAFVWISLAAAQTPRQLAHALTLEMNGETSTLSGVAVPVSRTVRRIIGSPLRGDHWLAANGPDNTADHRRTLLAFAGAGRIAQRFAIDWVRLNEDGRTFKGDPLLNASYRAYGADVLAVGDGTVRATHDGIPENKPDPVERAVAITPETLGGNYVIQQVADGAYAFYAHLQPGSLTVKPGDRVRRGQVLGKVGNTGNSTEPHLHFHLADRTGPFDAEGIPYALDAFESEAAANREEFSLVPFGNSLQVDPAAVTTWLRTTPHRRIREIPLMNAIVTFEAR